VSPRFRTASSVAGAGLALCASLALTAGPAAAAPVAPASPAAIDVPVTCVIEPSSPVTSRETATVRVSAPAQVRAGSDFSVSFQADVDTTRKVPMDVENFGFTTKFAVEGATPAAVSFAQAPVTARTGQAVPGQVFTKTLTAGAAGSTVSYRFTEFDYTFRLGPGGIDGIGRCTPDAGPVTVTTTTVTRATSWIERLIAALRGIFRPPTPPMAPAVAH
jgi:hypothetical protein